MYCFVVYPVYGLLLFVIMVAYLQCEGILDEWKQRQKMNAHKQLHAKSMVEIRKMIKTQNANEMKPTTPIPKRIIQVWFDKYPKNPQPNSQKYPPKFEKYVETVKQMNPDYEYMFFDKDQAEHFLQKHYPHYYSTYLRLPVFIQKIDFFRYVAIYHYGGFYMDLDIQSLLPLDETIIHHKAVFPVDEYVIAEAQHMKRFRRFHKNGIDFLLGQYAFGAVAGHAFIKRLVDKIHENIDAYERLMQPGEQYVYSTTGPDFVADEYMDFTEKEDIFILDNGKRQMFGEYGKHDYVGTWKS
jgi:mannosyltransferase OCH1-like enzyme